MNAAESFETLRRTPQCRTFIAGFRLFLAAMALTALSRGAHALGLPRNLFIGIVMVGFTGAICGWLLLMAGAVGLLLMIGPYPADPVGLGANLMISIFRSPRKPQGGAVESMPGASHETDTDAAEGGFGDDEDEVPPNRDDRRPALRSATPSIDGDL